MTEGEKKAIEYFKDDINYLEEELKRPNFLGRFITIKDKECKMLKILLNLIEKLQKENEELHKEIERQGNAREIEEEYFEKNFISKDKIREKIKEKEAEKEGVKNISLEEYAITSKELKESEICLLKSLLEED